MDRNTSQKSFKKFSRNSKTNNSKKGNGGNKKYTENKFSKKSFKDKSFKHTSSRENTKKTRSKSEFHKSKTETTKPDAKTKVSSSQFKNNAGSSTPHNTKSGLKSKSGSKFKARGEQPKRFQKNIRNKGKFPKKPNYNLEKKLPKKVKEKEELHQRHEIRLNKYIANAGICSRREADKLIESGMITVNGQKIIELGYKVLLSDTIRYGNTILKQENFTYILLNKPKDYITTTNDPQQRKTVMDLVTDAGEERFFPVGRLDRDTTGLLVLTNDGELAQKLMHPSYDVRKIYHVELDKPFTNEDYEHLTEGVLLDDGLAMVDEAVILTPDKRSVGLEIHSGKNRIIRRIFEHLGYKVIKLDRTMYAGLDKKELPRGHWRFLTEKEVIRIKYFA